MNSSERVILSAHFDSRGTFGAVRAPGGDDDGSGSGHLLAVVQAIKSQGVKFEKAVTVAFFAGEEQGLLGSQAYARGCDCLSSVIRLEGREDGESECDGPTPHPS